MNFYFKIAVRNLVRERKDSFFLLSSVCIGIITFMLVSGYVFYEKGFDRFFRDHKNIYRVTTEIFNENELTLHIPECERGVSFFLKENHPGVLAAGFLSQTNNPQFKIGEELFTNQYIYHASPGFLDVFSIPLIKGSAAEILTKPYTAVISERTAKKYFGATNPVGQVLFKYPAYEYVIEGVFKDIPRQAHFSAEVLLSFHDDMNLPPPVKAQWGETGFYTYLKLMPDAEINQVEAGINAVVRENKSSYFDMNSIHHQYHLQRLNDIHLHSNLRGELQPNARAQYVYLILIIGLLILFASGFNYIQYSFSRLVYSAKKTGIKKVNGASGSDIILSSLAESLVMHILALLISLFVARLLFPFIYNQFGIELEPVFTNPAFMVILLGIVLLSIILNGILPALLINRFNSFELLKLKYNPVSGSISIRQVIVVAQFVIIIAIISGIFGMNKQVRFLIRKDKGFDVKNTLVIKVPQNIRKASQRVNNLQAFENNLLGHTSIAGISSSNTIPGDLPSYNFNFREIQSKIGGKAAVIVADKNFISNYKIKLLAGNNFFDYSSGEENSGCIINRACLQVLGFQNPEDAVGRVLNMEDESGMQNFEAPILGVVENVDFSDAKQKHEPIILIDWTKEMLWGNYSIKATTSQYATILPFIRKVFTTTFPNHPFEYIILEDYYNSQFERENQLIKIFRMFIGVAILISVINLFSISLLISSARVKEIGIRKVNGAKVSEILTLLNKDFVKWVAIAFIIAAPVAYYAISKWLESFAYKTSLSWWVFALAGLLALGIALLTVSWQSWRAATRNPVEALRYE